MANQEIITGLLIGIFFIIFSFMLGHSEGYYNYWFINIFKPNKKHNKFKSY